MPPRLLIERAARVVLAGGIVAYPTEAVWGLGCLPLERSAALRIIALKKRSWRKGLLLIAADVEQLDPYLDFSRAPLRDQILESWPGPSTWTVPVRPFVPDWLTGGRDTLAVRVTAHPVAAALCARVGQALVSTSANVSRRPPLKHSLTVRRALGREVDWVLPGPLGDTARPTPIRDGQNGDVLRF
jgi:L-threonylcarbamoyladenylate synthase